MTVPALMPWLARHVGLTFVEIGLALTAFNLVTLIVQTPLGFLVDRIGPRRVLIAGLLLGGCSFLLLALTARYSMLVLVMATAGLANGVYHPANYAILSSEISEEKIGPAFSVHTFAGFLGTAAAPAILITSAGFGGLPAAFILSGLLGICGALVVAAGSKRLQMANEAHQPTPRIVPTLSNRRLQLPVIVSLMTFFLLLNLSTSGIQNFSVAALDLGFGVGLQLSGIALSGFLFSSALGVLVGGILAGWTVRHGLIAAAALATAAALVSIIAFTRLSPLALIMTMAAAGFLTGLIAPARDMMVRAVAPPGTEGRVFGIVSTGFNIGGMVGPVVFGWFLDTGSPRGIFLASIFFMMLTAGFALFQEYRVQRVTCQ